MKNQTTDVPKKDEEDFDLINLSSSVESCPLVSSTETTDVMEPRELDRNLDMIEPMELGDCASEILEPGIQNNLENSSPVTIINDDDYISLALVEVHRAPFDAFKATIKAELDNAIFAETAQSSHGVNVSHSFNRLGKTPESTDLLNVSDDGEISSLADSTDADRYDHLEDPQDRQNSSQHLKDFFPDDTKDQQPTDTVPSLDDYNALNTSQTSLRVQPGEITRLLNRTLRDEPPAYVACPVATDPDMGLKSKPDGRRMLSTSAETACMRDHIKLLDLTNE